MKRRIDASEARREPHLVWNAFIDLVATEDYADLSVLQRKAHLVFWYESEVQNGGHGQYFENQGIERLGETVEALRELGLACQPQVLSRAVDLLAAVRGDTHSVKSMPDGFAEELDEAFHDCRPDVTTALEEHLRVNQSEYVEVV